MVKKSILAKVGDKINYKLIRDGYKTGKGNVVVTAEMDTKTTITADVPSTAYTSNLDYEVDISGENPPIINIKNDITCPDDTVISKGKYLFYDVGQEYVVEDKDKIIEPIKNYTKVGNINVDSNGIASNFSTSNYIKLNTYLPPTFDIVIKYKHNDLGSQNGELIANPTDDNSLYVVYNSGKSKYKTFLYVKGVDDSFQTDNPVQYETGSWYWIRLIYDGNESKVYVIKDNNYTIKTLPTLSSWNHEQTNPVSNLWKDMYVTIGANLPYGKYNTGSIDLNNTYINEPGATYASYIPGIKDFTLKDNGNELTTKLFDYHYNKQIPAKQNYTKVGSVNVDSNGVASNFSTSNYIKSNYNVPSKMTRWELVVAFTLASTTQGCLISSLEYNGLGDIYINGGNQIRIWLSSDGGSYNIFNDKTISYPMALNKKYYLKWSYTNGIYSLDMSEDGKLYTNYLTMQSSTIIYGSNYILLGADYGTGSVSTPFQGTIYLEDSYSKYGENDKVFFKQNVSEESLCDLYTNPEKDNALYYEKDELQLNVSKVGSTIIDKKGIASNFGKNSYVTPGPINFGNGNWEMVVKAKYKSSTSTQYLCGTADNDHNQLILGKSVNNNGMLLFLSSNGTSWDIFSSGGNSPTTIFVDGATYYIKVLFNGTNYILSSSTDGINYNEEYNVESSTIISNPKSNLQFGFALSDSQYAWQGSIDLKESYIQIGSNEKQYFAENIKKRYDIPSLYSEFVDNITIPAHALYDYIDGEWKLSSTSPLITQDITVNADNAEITMKEIIE